MAITRILGLFAATVILIPGDAPAVAQELAAVALDQYRWPEFRGPRRDATAPEGQRPPLRWSEQEGVVWKLALEQRGWSSPVVWDGTAWMTEATPDGAEMMALAVDLASGQLRWRRTIFRNENVSENMHSMNSFASPTPVTDGQHVWVSFGSYGTACLDADTGQTQWSRRDLPCEHWRGPGSSPVLVDDKLILHMDGYDLQYVVALDAQTGKTVWKTDRDIDYGTDNGDQMKAFSTPIVIKAGGRRQLISPTAKAVLAYDPATGNEIWRVRFDEHSATAQPLFDGKAVYINTGFGKAELLAIDPTGRGDVTDTHVLWVQPRGIGSKPSPIVVDGLIYNVHDQGVASCIDTADGAVVWTKRLGGQFSASLLYAGGHVYWFDHDGKAYVTRPGRSFDLVAENELADGCMATPVPLGDRLLVRTRSALYLLGEP